MPTRRLLLALALALPFALAGGCKKKPAETTPPAPIVKLCDPAKCGPALGMPNTLCPDGKTTSGPTGRCLEHEDGTCGWEVLSCPADPGTGK